VGDSSPRANAYFGAGKTDEMIAQQYQQYTDIASEYWITLGHLDLWVDESVSTYKMGIPKMAPLSKKLYTALFPFIMAQFLQG
jgi:hypothetical protein